MQPAEGEGMAGAAGPTHYGGDGERAFPCVKLRGLPFDANEDEVRNFLVSSRGGAPQ